jgi:double-stranded uracil-DNA glycosylase
VVTAVELARRLEVSPKTLRAWLRGQASIGHPLLASHRHNDRWEFTASEADQLEAEYRGPARRQERPLTSNRSTQSRGPGAGHRVTEKWMGEEVETLEDLLRADLRAVCVGINPSPVSTAAGHYYQGRLGQAFYARLRQADLLPVDTDDYEDDALFKEGVGFTDIVKRPTKSEKDVLPEEFDHGRGLLADKLEHFRPKFVIFTFKKTATKLFGPFEGNGYRRELAIGGAEVFVMPGPYERTEIVQSALQNLRIALRT